MSNGANSGPAARVPLDIYLDYICPFCYAASHRLEGIAARHPLAVTYRFLEIHPDTPAEGRPLSELGYPPEQWERIVASSEAMIRQLDLPYLTRTFTTNSRRALLLGRTVFRRSPDRFPPLHRALLHAYFAEGRNIGDPEVLGEIAAQEQVTDLLPEAWQERTALEGLLADTEAAREAGVTGVPALRIGGRTFPGADALDILEQALRRQDEAER